VCLFVYVCLCKHVCVCVHACVCGEETDEHRTDSTNEFNIIAEFNIVLSAASG